MGTEQAVVLCALAVNSVSDIYTKEILPAPTILVSCAGFFRSLLCGEGLPFSLMGLIPGALVGVLSVFSRGAIGLGDALVLTAVGLWCGCGTAFLTFLSALVLQSAVSVIYRLSGGKKKELPFVPALLGGFLICVLIGYL